MAVEQDDVSAPSGDRENFPTVDPPIGWDGRTLQQMKRHSEERLDETGQYQGLDRLGLKQDHRFEYERMYSELRGIMVNARETALHISASPIVREIGELCFQIYTPEGDCVACSTGILVHVHTGSLAIKYMIDRDYEHEVGIQPGDIFCNNDCDVGNAHTADVHTFVPIFHEGELVAWVDGVTHEIDIGGFTPAQDQVAATSRYEDGLYVTCEKVGEEDEPFEYWKDRAQRAVRTPFFWDLNEKCRLAGCHMIREDVKDAIDEVGIGRYKQFMRESVEEGRRILQERVKVRLFPGEYQETSFWPVPFEEEAWKPTTRRDMLFHLPLSFEVNLDGSLRVDLEGASPPGPHPFNCSEGPMEAGMWVTLTQCLLHDGKVNDGAYFGVDAHYPEGSIVNADDHTLSYTSSWALLMAYLNSLWKCLSYGFFARGFREEVVAGFGETGDFLQGDGVRSDTGEYFSVSPFEISCQGMGASAVQDGLDWAYACWNPESDLGDVEKWEKLEKGLMYLARRVKPNTAGFGKYRGGSGWEILRTVQNSEDVNLYKLLYSGVAFTTSGMAGGYPAPRNYTLRAHDTDLEERFEKQLPYPLDDDPPGQFEQHLEGEIVRTQRGLYFPAVFEDYDVVHYQQQGGPGWGDPLRRDTSRLREDLEEGIYTQDVARDVFGVVGRWESEGEDFQVDEADTEQQRQHIRETRREESQPFDEFYEQERSRLTEGTENPLSEPVQEMYRGIFEQSDAWTERYRSFWELPEDFALKEDDDRE